MTTATDNESATQCRPVDLRIEGMSCAGCVARIEKALQAVPGVDRATVNLTAQSARVWTDTDDTPEATDQLIEAVRQSGYDAQPARRRTPAADDATAGERDRRREQRQAVITAFGIGLPIIVVHWLAHSLSSRWPGGHFWPNAVQLALTVMLFRSPAGGPILLSGIRAALWGVGTMDVLIALGVLSAFVSSVIGMFIGDPAFVHFHAAAMILIFINVGRYLETRARSHTADAVATLARMAPARARRRRNGSTEDVPVEEIAVGDHIVVVAEEDVPVDGKVVAGEAAIDAAVITGESTPIEAAEGTALAAGSRLLTGQVTLEATTTGDDTSITRLIHAVEQAQSGKTGMQRLADRVAGIFVPIVVGVALVTLAGWLIAGWLETGGWANLAVGLRCAIAVLVIACPCALGLATPTVVAVASGEAAIRGILVRDPAALESAGGINRIVFDKTGTLTVGKPTVRRVVAFDPSSNSEDEVLRLAAAVEQFADHPIARAIVNAAEEKSLALGEPESFEASLGLGVSAKIDGRTVFVGSERFLQKRGVETNDEAQDNAPHEPGATSVYVAADGVALGVLALADAPRPDAADTIRRLQQEGIAVAMVTGDQPAAARAIADALGIEDVSAAVLPFDKPAEVEKRRRAGETIAMVGDGTNDAAALAAADVGIAFATGTAPANAAAALSLVRPELAGVTRAVTMARDARRVIRQNLFWAFCYNVAAIPLAAFNILPPGYAAAAMMISSITVVLNALRLRRLIRRDDPAAAKP